jgi:hypothetical protein
VLLIFCMSKEEAQRLADLLREVRGDKSIRSFCADLDLHWSAWRNWEAGDALPRLEHLQMISSLKGWTLDQLSSYLRTGDPDLPPYSLGEIMEYARKLPLEERVELAKQLLAG